MNKSTTVVIAAAAALAAIIVTRTPAQVEYASTACCLPTGCLTGGAIGESDCVLNGGIFLEDATCTECPPPPGPTVVGIAAVPHFDVNGDPTTLIRVFRAWSDGETDITYVSGSNCGPPGVCGGPNQVIPGSCPTDIDRDGDTGINDFLTLLGGWGACR